MILERGSTRAALSSLGEYGERDFPDPSRKSVDRTCVGIDDVWRIRLLTFDMSSTSSPLPHMASSHHLPEQVFFNDPVLDRLMAVTMTLAAEVYVLRERIAALETQVQRVAEHAAQDTEFAVAMFDHSESQAQEDAAQFVRHVLEPLLGEQQSRGHA